MAKQVNCISISNETNIEYVWKMLNFNNSGYIIKNDILLFLNEDLTSNNADFKKIKEEVSAGEDLIDFKDFKTIYDKQTGKCQPTEDFEKRFNQILKDTLHPKQQEKNILQKIINLEFGTNMDALWLTLIIMIIVLNLFTCHDIFDIREKLRNSVFPNPESVLKSVSDVWIMLVTALCTCIFKQILYKIFHDSTNKRLAKYCYPDHAGRMERIHDYIFGSIFYGFSTVFTYYNWYGNANIPSLIGGSGTGLDVFDSWPQTKGNMHYAAIFQCIQIGYHFHNLVFLITCRTHKKTYLEMVLHHFLTFWMLFYGYWCNMTVMNIVGIMCHDGGDFFMNVAKLARDLDLVKGWKLDILYGLTIFGFLYPRVIVAWLTYLPACIILTFPENLVIGSLKAKIMPYVQINHYLGIRIQCYGQCCLSLMNLYWSILIIQVGYKKAKNNGYVAEFEGECSKRVIKKLPGEKLIDEKLNKKIG